MIWGPILGILEAGLSLWDTKEGRKYKDRVIHLKREWHEENDKPAHDRNDARLDLIERELRIIADTFTSSVGGKNSPDK